MISGEVTTFDIVILIVSRTNCRLLALNFCNCIRSANWLALLVPHQESDYAKKAGAKK